jgi:hypothetical protein
MNSKVGGDLYSLHFSKDLFPEAMLTQQCWLESSVIQVPTRSWAFDHRSTGRAASNTRNALCWRRAMRSSIGSSRIPSSAHSLASPKCMATFPSILSSTEMVWGWFNETPSPSWGGSAAEWGHQRGLHSQNEA